MNELTNTITIYEVSYLAGIVNTQEYSIKIESVVGLTDDYIRKEIEKQKPNHAGQIMQIFNPLNIGSKKITNNYDDILNGK